MMTFANLQNDIRYKQFDKIIFVSIPYKSGNKLILLMADPKFSQKTILDFFPEDWDLHVTELLQSFGQQEYTHIKTPITSISSEAQSILQQLKATANLTDADEVNEFQQAASFIMDEQGTLATGVAAATMKDDPITFFLLRSTKAGLPHHSDIVSRFIIQN